MSLLERRRALMELVQDEREGGGPNDGKYLVYTGFITTYYNLYGIYRSVDFGTSWATNTAYGGWVKSTGDINHNRNSGSVCYFTQQARNPVDDTGHTGSSETFVEFTSPNVVREVPNFVPTLNVVKNIIWSSDYSKSLYTVTAHPANSTIDTLNPPHSLNVWTKTSANGLTGSSTTVCTTASGMPALTLTSASTRLFPADAAYLEASRDNFKTIILSDNSWNYNGITASHAHISRDRGATWTAMNVALFSSQSADNNAGFYSAKCSNNGKKCLVVYRDSAAGVNKLYYSKNSAASFTEVTLPSDIGQPFFIEGSAQLKTWYLAGSRVTRSATYGVISTASLYRSQNEGATWTKIATHQDYLYCNNLSSYTEWAGGLAGRLQYLVACDDAGDRVLTQLWSSVGRFYTGSYQANQELPTVHGPVYLSSNYGSSFTEVISEQIIKNDQTKPNADAAFWAGQNAGTHRWYMSRDTQ